MAGQKDMPKSVRRHLESKRIDQKINRFVVRSVLGSGNTAVTYEVEDEYGLPWALKLVTRDSYGDRAPFREIARFAEARDRRYLVFPLEVDDWTLKLKGKSYEFVCFKSRPVRGQSLESFLDSNSNFNLTTEIERYIRNLTAALEELERLGFCHGDLHDRNIMREVIGEGGTDPEIRYVVIDFSEAHPVDAIDEGILRDLEYFGKHLRQFYDTAYRREALTREDEKILIAIRHLPGLLNGVAPESMRITKPAHIFERFNDGLRATKESPQKLRTPFDSLSAENIPNDALLADLCFTKTWWTAELEKNNNVLLIGPRGCGKTMIFRRLRLKTKIAAKRTRETKSDPYVAFYLPCESLFYMRFSDLSDADIEDSKYALILYFNMAILAEVCSTLCATPHSALGAVSADALFAITELFKDEIGGLWQHLGFPLFTSNPQEITDLAEQVMRYLRKSLSYREPVTPRGSTDFLTNLIHILKSKMPSLSDRYCIFLLDDYTEERVPITLQEALHPIVCQRSPDVCFKISAHMFGSIYSQPRPLALDEGRNILVINLGSAYLNLNRRTREGKLLLQILNERFKYCDGYDGKIEDWLGKTSYPGGRTLSWALHDKTTRSQVKYHGIKCLMELCTGDYSEMIRMIGEIFRDGRIDKGAPVRIIPAHIQDRAITRVSREFLGRVRHIRPDGQKLFDVTNSFGVLSQQVLYNRPPVGQGVDSRGRPRKDPFDLLTVYVDHLTKASRASRHVWERLQRASIFVDIGLAPSQRTVVSDRATLRRIYCPAFRTTLSSSEHLQATKEQFEWFMDRAEEFCEHKRGGDKDDQRTLWDKGQETTEVKPPMKEYPETPALPENEDRIDYIDKAPLMLRDAVAELPELSPLSKVLDQNARFDLFIGAMGFEQRTTASAEVLVKKGVTVKNAVLLEFDRFYRANEKRRPEYESLIKELTSGKPHRPLNSPVGSPDPIFSERLKGLLQAVAGAKPLKVLYDVTSCPSLILSNVLAVLLNCVCDLTLLYSEADEYFPTADEWESGRLKPDSIRILGPFEGVRFVAKPPTLQSDDLGELPILLVLFPTFNTERTTGVLAEIEPAARVWIFGEPHDLEKNAYRIDMAKSFAAPNICKEDPWSILSTFDYRKTLLALGGIYTHERFRHRMVVMPHGSKMQTIGVNIFAAAHQVSMVFAMAKTYDPKRYSEGCREVWGLCLGKSQDFVERLRAGRAFGGQ